MSEEKTNSEKSENGIFSQIWQEIRFLVNTCREESPLKYTILLTLSIISAVAIVVELLNWHFIPSLFSIEGTRTINDLIYIMSTSYLISLTIAIYIYSVPVDSYRFKFPVAVLLFLLGSFVLYLQFMSLNNLCAYVLNIDINSFLTFISVIVASLTLLISFSNFIKS